MFSTGNRHKIMKMEGGGGRANYLGNNNNTIIGEGGTLPSIVDNPMCHRIGVCGQTPILGKNIRQYSPIYDLAHFQFHTLIFYKNVIFWLQP